MFWSSSSRDMNVIFFMLFISVLVSVFICFKTKNKILSIFLLSLLGYLSIYLNIRSEFFIIYHLKSIVKFTLWYWPWINVGLFILLIINFIKNKYVKKEKVN